VIAYFLTRPTRVLFFTSPVLDPPPSLHPFFVSHPPTSCCSPLVVSGRLIHWGPSHPCVPESGLSAAFIPPRSFPTYYGEQMFQRAGRRAAPSPANPLPLIISPLSFIIAATGCSHTSDIHSHIISSGIDNAPLFSSSCPTLP
jgi:hypothetical protein